MNHKEMSDTEFRGFAICVALAMQQCEDIQTAVDANILLMKNGDKRVVSLLLLSMNVKYPEGILTAPEIANAAKERSDIFCQEAMRYAEKHPEVTSYIEGTKDGT